MTLPGAHPFFQPPPSPYRQGDFVQCEGCRRNFIARARATSCVRCGGHALRKLTAKP